MITCYVGPQLYTGMFNGEPRLTWMDCHPKAAAAEKKRLVDAGHRHFATYNPYIVDCFTPDEVLVVLRDECRIRWGLSLAEHPEINASHKGLSSGELWTAVGEDWILDHPRKEAR